MLKNSHRKILLEHDLLYFLSKDSNPHQQWKRTKKKCLLALRDLALIASKSPNDKLQQIFDESTLNKLLEALFLRDHSEPQAKLRSPDVQLASLFAYMGISVCIWEYEKLNKDTPESSKPTVDLLNRAIAICKETGYKYKLDLMERDSVEKKLTLICIWEEIVLKHKNQFYKYVTKESPIKGIMDMSSKTINSNEMEFYLFDLSDPKESEYLGKVIININPIENKGKIKFYNDKNEEIKSKDLILEKYGSQTAIFSR